MTMTDNKDDEMDWLECLQHKEATCVYLQAVLDDYQQKSRQTHVVLGIKECGKSPRWCHPVGEKSQYWP